MILNGKYLHAYILSFFEPVEWITNFSLVSKTWNNVAKSDLLWNTVREKILVDLPAMSSYIERKHIYVSIKDIYTKDSRFILSNLALCSQLGILNLDEYIRDTVEVYLLTRARQNTVLIQYRSIHQPQLSMQQTITQLRNTDWFLEPLRQLIKYKRVKHEERLMLWGNTMMNILLVNEISKKRKRAG